MQKFNFQRRFNTDISDYAVLDVQYIGHKLEEEAKAQSEARMKAEQEREDKLQQRKNELRMKQEMYNKRRRT